MSILLADDDVNLATFLSKSLESEGYSVHTALDEGSVLAELRRQNYKLIILDLNFGATDGLKLLEKLRSEGLATPVMVLSARNKVSDRIQSLNLGADDYVTKPFSFQELAARANALLRRKADPTLNVLRVEDLELDPAIRKVTRGSREIKLSPKEFELLHLLMRRAGDPVSRQELLRLSWGLQPDTDSNLVDVYVNYLRRKTAVAGEQQLIHTVRGIGYRLGRPASVVHAHSDTGKASRELPQFTASTSQSGANSAEALVVQQTPLRGLINSVAHDLAQPLTSVRCFLEVIAMRNGAVSVPAPDLKSIEQQADRAIGLAKTIASLVREVSMPSGPWLSLENLLNDVFNDFVVLTNSGLLAIDRQGESSIQVTSSPVLRQLLAVFIGKLVGKNTRALTLTVSAEAQAGRCTLSLRWKAAEQPGAVQDARTVLAKDLPHIQEIVSSIGGEMTLAEGAPEISLKLPSAPTSAGSKQRVH
jgi:DNA-binding response OmpR family regulator